MRNVTKTPDEPLALRVDAFCKRLGIGQSCFWKYQKLGKIHTISVGRRVLIPSDEVSRILREGVGKR